MALGQRVDRAGCMMLLLGLTAGTSPSLAFLHIPSGLRRCSAAGQCLPQSLAPGTGRDRRAGRRVGAACLRSAGGTTEAATPFPEGRYDPLTARAYFLRRPWEAAARAWEIVAYALELFLSVWLDQLLGRVAECEEQRAREAVQVIAKLGPTFVKIGQSLSVRGDLLPAAYIEQLTTLQDRVPFFDDAEAKKIIAEELGAASLSEVFSSISPQPVAAASLGQVYRATLREGGREVAVKVQRPSAARLIACDLFLLRLVAAPLLARLELFAGVLSMEALIDELGARFVDELDYSLEAGHAEEFNAAMAAQGLDMVFAAAPVRAACSRRVLTCEWIDGVSLAAAGRAYIHTYTHAYIHTYMHTYIHIYICTYLHTYRHVVIITHIHA